MINIISREGKRLNCNDLNAIKLYSNQPEVCYLYCKIETVTLLPMQSVLHGRREMNYDFLFL